MTSPRGSREGSPTSRWISRALHGTLPQMPPSDESTRRYWTGPTPPSKRSPRSTSRKRLRHTPRRQPTTRRANQRRAPVGRDRYQTGLAAASDLPAVPPAPDAELPSRRNRPVTTSATHPPTTDRPPCVRSRGGAVCRNVSPNPRFYRVKPTGQSQLPHPCLLTPDWSTPDQSEHPYSLLTRPINHRA